MTKRLSPEVLALRAPLDAYTEAEAAAEVAERGYRAAQNALESYRAAMDNGQCDDDSLVQTLRKEMEARRKAQERAETQLAEATAWVRSVLTGAAGTDARPSGTAEVSESIPEASPAPQLSEAKAEEPPELAEREMPSTEIREEPVEGPDPIEDLLRDDGPNLDSEPVETEAEPARVSESIPEGSPAPQLSEAAGTEPPELAERGMAPTEGSEEPALEPEPVTMDAGEAPEAQEDTEVKGDADVAEGVSFEALLRGEGAAPPSDRAERAPRPEPAAQRETPTRQAAEKHKAKAKPSTRSPAPASPQAPHGHDRLWADVLSEEGDDGLLPSGGRTMMGAVVTACMLFGGLMKPLVGAKTPTLDRVTRHAQQATVLNIGSDEVTPVPAVTGASVASGWTHLAATPVPGNVALVQEAPQIETVAITQTLSVPVPREVLLWNGTAMGVEPATMEQETQQWQLPGDRSRLGWHTNTSPCGKGVAVIGGHVSFDGMPGPLSGLAGIGPEDVIECAGSDGQTHRYVPQDYLISSVDEKVEDWYPGWERPALLLYTCTPELDGSLMVVRFVLQ